MNPKRSVDYFLVVAVLITVANVILIWAYRFLPLYDYPMWLYEVHIMKELSDPLFARNYDLLLVPVPNLGLVGPVWILHLFLPLEIAGKAFLTLCVVGLPWSFRFCVRSVSGKERSWAEYFAFPFSFGCFFFLGQGFLFGLGVLLLSMGYFLPRLDKSRSLLFLLSLDLLLLYFLHAIVFLLMIVVLMSNALALRYSARSMMRLSLACIPACAGAVVYLLFYQGGEPRELQWNFWILSQNVLKSMFLFIRSSGIPNRLPLTALNGLWLLTVLGFIVVAFKQASAQSGIDKRFAMAALVAFLLMVSLPGSFLGVVQPGVRFGLPLLFFLALMAARADMGRWAKSVLLGATCIVCVYNNTHFAETNRRMGLIYNDIEATVNTRDPFGVYRFDWPAGRDWWDVGSNSIDPYFGSPYYVQLHRGGVGEIFNTSLLRLRPEAYRFLPRFRELSRDELTPVYISERRRFDSLRYLVVIGKNIDQERFVAAMAADRFVTRKRGEFWTIMEAKHYEEPLEK